ncbi:alpha-1,4-glucan--maltose-1-phosphate maltosyltransferase [Derxia lacustris]|uniref:alpha-1,4-glucan--maltose-1-phosphate maltosyltransferase n=1 Tax=Derxia lacustris TaxID=764842 RepID=UPI000A171FCD
MLDTHSGKPILQPVARGKKAALAATRAARIVIENLDPDAGPDCVAIKRCVGDTVTVEADIYADGHDRLAARLLWRATDSADWQAVPMTPLPNDRWRASFVPRRLGRHEFTVEAWWDRWATLVDHLVRKRAAGQPLGVEVAEARALLDAASAGASSAQADAIDRACARLDALADAAAAGAAPVADADADTDANHAEAGGTAGAAMTGEGVAAPDLAARPEPALDLLLSDELGAIVHDTLERAFLVRAEPPVALDAERLRARFASWYELFPRSITDSPERHGTFADVIGRLPAISAMGFDVLYFPPIHPIGRSHRKGRNNTLTAAPDDPGSPYAIGSEEGGHDAIHPQLGTLDDFRQLRDAAADHGLELAIDFAIQCSPDHPWLKQHPGWFAWRPDGSIKHAENPPKKYEDIVNVDFYARDAMPDLWIALRDVVLFWVKEGVKIFRVDNPHTKPLPFWQWLIAEVRGRHPETMFLSEAFTRPKPMYRLGKVGFNQSYSYFTWRNTKAEFIQYLTELSAPPVRDVYRPNFFVNTPDINPKFLHDSGRPGFLIRAALAATLSGLWGVFAGFELCESAPVPGKEEYLDSDKYEIRPRDWNAPGNIIGEIAALNRVRRENPALQTHTNAQFLNCWNDNILYFAKATEDLSNFILVAINLDPKRVQEADFELPLWLFGLPDDGSLAGEDLMTGHKWIWTGKMQHTRLDPWFAPYGVWRVSRG